MEAKGIIGIAGVILMGIVVFGIVSLINATLDGLDSKCKTCGEDCKIRSCTDNSSSTGRMISTGLTGIYVLAAIGILFFSFRKDEDEDEEDKPVAENPTQQQGNEFAYG